MRTTAELQCAPGGALPAAVRDATVPPPTRLFDNLYYVGLAGVGAYAIKTNDGIVLIDALNSTADAQNVIEPGLRQLGFNPADVKYIIVTHGHGDHYGGARYFAEHYGTRVFMSEADWQMAASRPFPPGGDASRFTPPPAKNLIVSDGLLFELGGQQIRMVLTPGHTPGTVSLILPVTHHGQKHVLAMWGGTGIPRDRGAQEQYIASSLKFEQIARKAGADAELSNHPFVDASLSRMSALRDRPKGANPFVIGRPNYLRYSGIITACARAAAARPVAPAGPR